MVIASSSRLCRPLALIALFLLPPAVAGEPDASDIHTISTAFKFADGSVQHKHGTGFVIGKRYYTAYHNIQDVDGVVTTTIELDGEVVIPDQIDREHDLAVFELEGDLCASLCSTVKRSNLNVTPDTAVTWTQKVGEERRWKRAEINNLAYLASITSGGCEDNLVAEVNQPFIAGSSGGPVFDEQTGAIIGLIQGSFESRDGTQSGFFKPMTCVQERLHPDEQSTQFAAVTSGRLRPR